MKSIKIVILCTLLSFFSFLSMANANLLDGLGKTNPEGTFELGFELNTSSQNIQGDSFTKNQEVGSSSYLIQGIYALTDRINMIGKVGMAEIWSEDTHVFINKGFGLESAPIVSGGFNVNLYKLKKINIGMLIQYAKYSSKQVETDSAYINGTTVGTWEGKFELSLSSIDIAIGTLYEFTQKLQSQFGIVYSDVKGEATVAHKTTGLYPGVNFRVKGDYENSNNLGLYIGSKYRIGSNFQTGLGIKLLSETSLGVNMSYLF